MGRVRAFMHALLLAVVVAASPVSIAIGGLNGVKLAPGEADLYAELLAQKLTQRNFKVLTARDVSSMLGLERQKQLLGCQEGQSCITEMVGALGVDALVLGDVGELGGEYVINLKALSAKNGTTLALYNNRVPSAKDMSAELDRASRALARQLSTALQHPELDPGPDVVATVSSGGSVRRWSLAPAIVGVVLLAGGIVCEVQAHSLYTQTFTGSTVTQVNDSYNTGRTLEPLGYAGIAIGSAAIVAAIIMFATGGVEVQPTLTLSPSSVGFGFAGVLP